MLHPPSIFRARMIRIAAARRVWWSTSLRVWAGATTIDSPVWSPIGSTFSMEQIVMQLSAASRITSYSNSSQPSTDSSTRTCLIRELRAQVQSRLPAHSAEDAVRPFLRDDLLQEFDRQGLDVHGVGHLHVRLDRGGVRVHEDRAEPLLPARAARLGARVVELRSLSDHDGPGPDDEDGPEVRPLRRAVTSVPSRRIPGRCTRCPTGPGGPRDGIAPRTRGAPCGSSPPSCCRSGSCG